jgi:hypothetical protein
LNLSGFFFSCLKIVFLLIFNFCFLEDKGIIEKKMAFLKNSSSLMSHFSTLEKSGGTLENTVVV